MEEDPDGVSDAVDDKEALNDDFVEDAGQVTVTETDGEEEKVVLEKEVVNCLEEDSVLDRDTETVFVKECEDHDVDTVSETDGLWLIDGEHDMENEVADTVNEGEVDLERKYEPVMDCVGDVLLKDGEGEDETDVCDEVWLGEEGEKETDLDEEHEAVAVVNEQDIV